MDTAEAASSPGSLSSPPHSPTQSTPNNSTIRVATPAGVGVAANAGTPTPASATTTPRLTAAGQPRKKPGPKPKPKDPNEEKKSRKPRKTAEPKDPSVAPAPRKRRAKASLEAQAAPAPAHVEEKPVVQQTPALQTQPAELVSVLQPEQPLPVAQAPRVLSNPDPLHGNPNLLHVSNVPSTPRPASSGQRYDPIRGGLFESKPPPPPPPASAPPPISPPLNRASASPSITSLIDPPTAANSAYPQATRLQQSSVTSAPLSPGLSSNRSGSLFPNHDTQVQSQLQPQQQFQSQPPQPPHPTAPFGPTPMDIDSDVAHKVSVPMKRSDSTSAGTTSNSNAPTPPVKAARQKEAPPPLPTGSGLLSGTPFGPVPNANGSAEPEGVNIYLTFPLKGRENITINFAQEVEKKYGFAALHPRIAARRERQRQITAAGAALEKAAGQGSADDMSLDLSEPESNNEVTGVDEDGSAAGNGTKKRRKRKQEDYDKEDDFIDDTELAWEQQALMAKDGFFVYSGPLVTEEKPAVERYAMSMPVTICPPLTISRADGTVRRGRGRGRGGSTRGETSGRGRGRGGGPGSRGGQTVRKPRVTKADRAMMEREKLEREKLAQNMGIASKQPAVAHGPAYVGVGTL